MNVLIGWFSSNTAALGILGAAVAFIVSTWQQVSQRRAEANERQFQAFHKVVENIVSPDRKDGSVYIDRLAAFTFELRHFPRYYDFTERLLMRLKKRCIDEPCPQADIFEKEIDLTLEHIQRNK